jgi:NADPH:quinone reductase-like Zn-dependent oxidoreductase
VVEEEWDNTVSSSTRSSVITDGRLTETSAIQLAKLSGFEVITTASPDRREQLESIGASVVVDRHSSNLAHELRDLLQDVKYVLDSVSTPDTDTLLLDVLPPKSIVMQTHRVTASTAETAKTKDISFKFVLGISYMVPETW